MYLARLETKGFRRLDNFSINFEPGLNVIVGSNNAGKTAILGAISLVLSHHDPSRAIYVNNEDFWHSADGADQEQNRLEITLTLNDVPNPSPYHSKWIDVEKGTRFARITLTCDPGNDKLRPRLSVGKGVLDVSDDAMDRIRPIFLPPLRDAESALRPGRSSRLARLIQEIAKAKGIDTKEIEGKFKTIHDEIIGKPPFSETSERINSRLLQVGGFLHNQSVSLSFVPPEFRRITESLQMRVGFEGSADFALTENGLGYNNLLYIATVLSELSKDTDRDMRLLLIEEPEAHLHPQMQQVLVDALIRASGTEQDEGEQRTQVIMTTHSPLLAAHVPVQDVVVLHEHKVEPERTASDTTRPRLGKPRASAIRRFGLSDKNLTDLSRYLDSTKANLFFAQGVILVEGIAETLLFPEFAKAINRPLSDFHVSIVNIDGLAFDPFLQLFNDVVRLQIPCAIVTDSDPRFRPGDKFYGKKPVEQYDADSEAETDGDEFLFPQALITYGRAHDLEQVAATRSGAKVFRNLKTLEYDLALTGYLEYMLQVYATLDPDAVGEMRDAIAGETDSRKKAIRFFKRFDPKSKGRFAQALANRLDERVKEHWRAQKAEHGDDRTRWAQYLAPPAYIAGAIKWVTGDCNW